MQETVLYASAGPIRKGTKEKQFKRGAVRYEISKPRLIKSVVSLAVKGGVWDLLIEHDNVGDEKGSSVTKSKVKRRRYKCRTCRVKRLNTEQRSRIGCGPAVLDSNCSGINKFNRMAKKHASEHTYDYGILLILSRDPWMRGEHVGQLILLNGPKGPMLLRTINIASIVCQWPHQTM